MPAGCRMGRGAEASEGVLPLLLLVSIGSPAVTSMGCSTEMFGRRDGQVLSVGPQDQQSPPTNFTGLEKKNSKIFLYLRYKKNMDLLFWWFNWGQNKVQTQNWIHLSTIKPKTFYCYLTGVLGLPGNLRGERTFGSNENLSLTFSSTDGAMYVKPWRSSAGTEKKDIMSPALHRPDSKNRPQLMMSNEMLSKPEHAMWSTVIEASRNRKQD